MRICVCGLGRVGQPIIANFRRQGIECVGYDSEPSRTERDYIYCVEHSDACVFMVPTPSLPDGSFSNACLTVALRNFHNYAPADYLYIIGSTVTPGSCESFKEIVGENICYKPELIRLAYVREDLETPNFHLIGSDSQAAYEKCEPLYKGLVPIKRMSLVEAELTKITLNCALTMRISMANQLYLVAKRMGADPERIMEAVGSDPRIGHAYLTPGAPFGGPCLPRDNRMFAYVARQVGVEARLSEATDWINELEEIKGLPEIQKW